MCILVLCVQLLSWGCGHLLHNIMFMLFIFVGSIDRFIDGVRNAISSLTVCTFMCNHVYSYSLLTVCAHAFLLVCSHG